jgi:uncharacterized protein YndB with AHSA1/START domain
VNDQTVTIRKVLPAPCEEVFDAWLDAYGMREWMRPGSVANCDVTLEPRVGGHFRIGMSSSGPDVEVVNRGEFLILDRPSKLQFTWVSPRWDNQETLVTVELRQLGSNCELVLTHERFPAEHSSKQLVAGWQQILDRFSGYLRCRETLGRNQ